MSMDWVLIPSCGGCGTAEELYGTTCKHLTLCISCGKTMAENGASCYECGTPITRLIREVMLVKEENSSSAAVKNNVHLKTVSAQSSTETHSESGTPQTSTKNGSSPSPVQATGPVTEDEIRAMLSQKTPVTTLDLVAKFKPRLETRESKDAFVEIVKKIIVQATGPVTEDEVRAVLSQNTQVTTLDLVAMFKSRLKTREDKDAFAGLLKKISMIQNVNGKKIVVLREKRLEEILIKEENSSSAAIKNSKTVSPQSESGTPQTSTKNDSSPSPVQATGLVTEDEIRAVLSQKTPMTTLDLVAKFKSRLETREGKEAFVEILNKISKIQTVNGKKTIVLRENPLSLLKSYMRNERDAVAREEDGID